MRVGIIGLGSVSVMHISALIKRHEDIVCICDINIEKCKTSIEKYNLKCAIYTDYIKMLNEEHLDVVHICTPHYLHCEMVCECLKRDINVLCEKPLAISYSGLDKIEEYKRKTKATLGICFQNRYSESVKIAKDYFKDKIVTSASASVFWSRDKEYYQNDAWRGKKETEGGGVMINQAIHTLDILKYVCGMPTKVIANISNVSLKGIIDVEDTAFGRFTYDNGIFVISATNSSSYTFPNQIMFHSDGNTLIIADDNIILNGKPYLEGQNKDLIGKHAWGYGHEYLINDFYDCLINNTKFSIDFDEGASTLRLVLAMYESNGNEIEIDK